MTAPFAQWHAELTEALEAARAELAVHEAERDQAQLDARAARADKAAVAKQFALIAPRQLAGALQIRRHGWDQRMAEAAGQLNRATNAIDATRRKVQDLEPGLTQLGQISPQPDDADTSEAA
jgi:hypothetical protein